MGLDWFLRAQAGEDQEERYEDPKAEALFSDEL